MISKRRDDKGRVLQQGEWQEPSEDIVINIQIHLESEKYYIVGD